MAGRGGGAARAAVVALGALLIAQAGDETTPVTERTTALTVEVPAPNEVVEAVDAERLCAERWGQRGIGPPPSPRTLW